MILIQLSAGDVASVRWAPSPVFEILAWLRLTADGRRHPLLGDPGPAARFALRQRDVAMVADVVRGVHDYMPDLFTPKPSAGPSGRVLRDQLSAVRDTAQSTVHTQYLGVGEDAEVPIPVRRAIDSTQFTARVANGLYQFWRSALSDGWKGVDEALTADVHRRAQVIASHGLGTAFGSLHAGIGWHDGQLRLATACDPGFSVPRQRDLVLAPSMLSWAVISVQVTDPDNAVITYPVDRAPEARGRRPPSASLLGRTRTAILIGLNAARTTTELSRRLDLAPSTVSHHLTVLVEAGMATRLRQGPIVHYGRTPEGDALAATLAV